MTVAVNPVQRNNDGLDGILKAVQLATSVYGAKLDKDRQAKLDNLAAQRYEQERADKASSVAGEQEFQMKKLAEEQKFKAQQSALDAKNKASETKSLKLPASSVSEIADLKNVNGLIDQLESEYTKNASSTGSGIMQWMPGSKANQYEKFKALAVQAIGKPLEGGKMTDSDRDYYFSLMPKSTDSPAQAKAKIDGLRQIAERKLGNQLETLSQAGYETANFGSGLKSGGQTSSVDPELEALLAEKTKRLKLSNTAGK